MSFSSNYLHYICFTEKNCSTAPDIDNGAITYSPPGDTTCGSTLTYSCNTGYIFTPDGNETRFCGEDSIWNGTAKNCTSKFIYVHIIFTLMPWTIYVKKSVITVEDSRRRIGSTCAPYPMSCPLCRVCLVCQNRSSDSKFTGFQSQNPAEMTILPFETLKISNDAPPPWSDHWIHHYIKFLSYF